MPLTVEYRPADPSDAAALSRLAHRAKAHWNYPADWMARWKRDLTITPEYLTVNLAFVAVSDETPIGVCVLQQTPIASLEHVWIDPAWHGRGIGRVLVQQALEKARELGFTRVEVQADPNAGEFYARLGAHLIGSVPAPMPGDRTRTLPLYEFRLD
jgi:GNAT superfamily N-acetyltransferase